jgi:hypothetical protein
MPLHYYFLWLLSWLSFHTHLALDIVPEAFTDKFGLHMDRPLRIIIVVKWREAGFLVKRH